MTSYRIYTEDVDHAGIYQIMDRYFDSYTVIHANGVWEGQHEKTVILEIVEDETDAVVVGVKLAATQIRDLNNQQSVLVTVNKLDDWELV
jgi:hypothetical protein